MCVLQVSVLNKPSETEASTRLMHLLVYFPKQAKPCHFIPGVETENGKTKRHRDERKCWVGFLFWYFLTRVCMTKSNLLTEAYCRGSFSS